MNNKKYIIAGFLSLVPIYLTYVIAKFLFKSVAKPGSQIIDRFFPQVADYSVIIGFIGVLVAIYIIGMLVSNILVKNILVNLEKLISDIPVVNMIYQTIKQITSSLGDPEKESFKKVILIEYPRKGVWTLAMVTGESKNEHGELFYHIFLPTTPNPTSGYFLYIPQKDTQETNMTIEEGMKIIISGGMLAPKTNILNS